MVLLICSHTPHGKLQHTAECAGGRAGQSDRLARSQEARVSAERPGAPQGGLRSGGHVRSRVETPPGDPAVQAS